MKLLIDSGSTLNIVNTDTFSKNYKEKHKVRKSYGVGKIPTY